ncbi:putative two-component system hydrogenase maturation factor HypX/HoxX [Streptacidiphilus sp. BW17]|uniref:enoyl-CoA hydratase-related protein n=1 Tax=Streptacidiphilus sp. BW17 TaxID=3156274 RepID=UPI003516B135
MRILLYSSAFNSFTQRTCVELTQRGHDLVVALDLGGGEAGAQELRMAVDRHNPHLIIAPMLTTAIPEDVWTRHTCMIVHPGPPGDRGPSSLDWALANDVRTWGVTVLQAVAAMDAGPVWAWERLRIPDQISKSALYAGEIADAASKALLRAVERFFDGQTPKDPPPGQTRPYYRQDLRRIDWSSETAAAISRKLRTADSSPGVLDEVGGSQFYLYGGQVEDQLSGPPGALVATRGGAVCRATADGKGVWLTSARPRRVAGGPPTAKAPASMALAAHLDGVPDVPAPLTWPDNQQSYSVVRYREIGVVGHLELAHPAGALSAADCRQLLDAYRYASSRPTKVLVLDSGRTMSTGIHLGAIEAAEDPAAATWETIQAIDDVAEAILGTSDKLTVAALGAGGAAGGLMLALACDQVWVRSGSVLNPHYQNVKLYGSELWSLTLPRRVGPDAAAALTARPLPIGTEHALSLGLVDRIVQASPGGFRWDVLKAAIRLARDPDYAGYLRDKRANAPSPEQIARHREAELSEMHRCIYGPGEPYHQLRTDFMHKAPLASTPAHLAYFPATSTETAAD